MGKRAGPGKEPGSRTRSGTCQILADLLCLMEATPWGIEGEHDSWLGRVAERLPPSLNAGGTQGAGFFKAADEGQIRAAKHVCEARLKAAEEDFEGSKIDMSKLLKRKSAGISGEASAWRRSPSLKVWKLTRKRGLVHYRIAPTRSLPGTGATTWPTHSAMNSRSTAPCFAYIPHAP